MKNLFFLLLFISSVVFGKDTDIAIQKTDTTKYTLKDTLHLTLQPYGSKPNVYFIKEPTKSSFFKEILPILTLILGIGINKFLDWLKDKQKITKAGERWVAEIRSLENPLTQQVELLQKSLELEKQYEYASLPIVSTLDCEIFKSLDKSDLLKFIERHKKNNYHEAVVISNQTHGFISILVHLHSTLQEKYADFIKETSKHITTINESLQELSRNFARYGVALEMELGKAPLDDDRYRPILDLFNKYIEPHRNDGTFDLFQLDEYFLKPLTSIFAALRYDERTNAMADATLGCVNGIKGIRMEKHYWAVNTKSIIELYQKQLNDLSTIANNIENRQE